MNVMIIGAGFTGIQLAKRLINEKNDVILIDNDEDTVRHANNSLDCTVILADGNNLQTLENAGIAKMDALVAVTESDEVNMITCSLVDSLYPRLLKIARVRNDSYYVNKSEVSKRNSETFKGTQRPLYGINYMIHPDIEAAKAIVHAVEHGAVSDVLSFGDGDKELTAIQIEKGSKLDAIKLKNVHTVSEKPFIIVYVESDEGAFLPSGETVLHAGDRIGVLTSPEDVKELLSLCGTKTDAIKKIALVGAGKIGMIVSEYIMEQNHSRLFKRLFATKNFGQKFVIIDSDREICKSAKAKFPTAEVYCADITDETFIREEGLDKYNLVICATNNHEMNMVVSAYLESLGVEKTIALVGRSAFVDIARKLGVDVPVPLRDTLVDTIMSHLKGKRVTGLHTVANGEFEIVECDISATSKFNGKMLKNISIPGEFLILLVKKPGQTAYSIPNGNTMLSSGDHIVLIEKAGDKKILDKISSNQ